MKVNYKEEMQVYMERLNEVRKEMLKVDSILTSLFSIVGTLLVVTVLWGLYEFFMPNKVLNGAVDATLIATFFFMIPTGIYNLKKNKLETHEARLSRLVKALEERINEEDV